MNHFFCSTRLVGGFGAAFLALPAQAATMSVINWGGQYVDADLQFADDTPLNRSASDKYGDPSPVFAINATDTIVGRALDTTNPFTPPVGYAGTSGTIYGAGTVTRMGGGGTNDGFSEVSVLNQGPNDSLHWHVDTGGDAHTYHMLLYWDKADFLGGASSTPGLELGDGAFTIGTAQESGHHTDEVLRWVVRDGNQFYVSETTVLLTNNAQITTPYSSLVNWAPYNPVDPVGAPTLNDLLSVDFDENGPYAPQTFTDVTALGFYVEHEAATGPIHVHIEGFEATLVPEPGSLLLVLAGLAGVVGVRRRH